MSCPIHELARLERRQRGGNYEPTSSLVRGACVLERLDEDGFTLILYIEKPVWLKSPRTGEMVCVSGGDITTNIWSGWRALYSFPAKGGAPRELIKKSNRLVVKWLRLLKARGYDNPRFLKRWEDYKEFPRSYR